VIDVCKRGEIDACCQGENIYRDMEVYLEANIYVREEGGKCTFLVELCFVFGAHDC